MIGFFIGAGFSKYSADLPLVNQLFDFEISDIRAKDNIWIQKIKKEKRKWNLDNQESLNDEEFISHIINNKGKRLNKYLSKYITRRISEPFLIRIHGGSAQTLMIDDNECNTNTLILKARQFLKSFNISDIYGIITTNYDLLIEYVLGTNGFKYGESETQLNGMGKNRSFPEQGIPVIADGNIILSKLHGSISYDGNDYWTSGKCGINGDAKILLPSPEKTRDTRFEKAWNNAEKIFNNIDKLIIFGFNFNEYDQAVLELLKTNSVNIKEVHIYDIESKLSKATRIWDENKITEHII